MQLWCSSPSPVYLITVSLRSEPPLISCWNVHDLLAANELMPREIAESTFITLNLPIDEAKDVRELADDVRAVYKAFDSAANDLTQVAHDLAKSPAGRVDQQALDRLVGRLGRSYAASTDEASSVMLELIIYSWERLPNRLSYGYPVLHVRRGLDCRTARGLTAAFVALLYMESDVIHWIRDDLQRLAADGDAETTTTALAAAMRHLHCTPFAGSAFGYQIIGAKLALLATWALPSDEVVSSLTDLSRSLALWSESPETEAAVDTRLSMMSDGAGIRYLRDSSMASRIALDLLRFMLDTIVAEEAWRRWEKGLLDGGPYVSLLHDWTSEQCIIDTLSLEYTATSRSDIPLGLWNVTELRPRRFAALAPEVQHLLRIGVVTHPSPTTRFRCALVMDDDRATLATPVLAQISAYLQESQGDGSRTAALVNLASRVRAWVDYRPPFHGN